MRRNFIFGVLNGLFVVVGEALMDPTLVLVAFVSQLTTSPFWIGLVVPLRDGAWFLPQLWVSGRLQSQPHKLPYYARMMVLRMLGLGLLCVAVFTLHDPGWLLAALFLAFGLYALASGLSGLPFLELISKTVPPRQRGPFFAWRLTLGGIMALGASAVVRWLLTKPGPLAFPYNFGVLFGLSSVLLSVGMSMLLLIREPPDQATRPSVSLWSQLCRALPLLRADHNFQRFLVLRMALMLAGSASPFVAVFVQQQLGGPLDMVGVYLGVLTGSSLLANMLFGRLSVRWGNRRAMVLASALGLAMSAAVLALATFGRRAGLWGLAAALAVLPAYILLGAREAGIGVAATSLLLDIAPPGERSVYLGFTNSLLGLVLLSTGLSGLVVAQFGFQSLVTLALAAHGVALIVALQMRDVTLA